MSIIQIPEEVKLFKELLTNRTGDQFQITIDGTHIDITKSESEKSLTIKYKSGKGFGFFRNKEEEDFNPGVERYFESVDRTITEVLKYF